MMKKQLLSLVTLLCVVWLTPARALAYDFEVDGIYYNITSSSNPLTVEVTNNGNDYEYAGAITIPERVTYNNVTYSVTSIGDSAFNGCSGLTSIEIPASVTRIGFRAFRTCTGLTLIVVAAGNPNYDSRENCNAIIETSSNTLIQGCKTTVIPASVTSIGQLAFDGCTGLTSIEIPASVTYIYEMAFDSCSGLTSIVVAAGNPNYDSRENCNAIIETSSNKLLQGCKTTVIPASVTSIEHRAFAGCSGLTSIEIPASVTSIRDGAFLGCTGLTEIFSRASAPPACDDEVWMKVNKSTCTLYVPAGTKDAYATAEGWKDFINIEEFDATEITTLDAEATDTDLSDSEIYTMGGQRVDALQAGMNIVRMKNGKVKKIVKR